MATMLGNWYARIKGGWKTVNASGIGAFASSHDWLPQEVGPLNAMKLSAYYACVRLIAEIMGSMTFEIYDQKNQLVTQHDLYGLMDGPNQFQTGDTFISAMSTNKTIFGNSMAHIKRLAGKPYMLDFYASDVWRVDKDDWSRPIFYLQGELIPPEDVLHWQGVSMSGYWGLPTLLTGAETLALQTASNHSAARTFSSGLRAGGFFEMPDNRQAFNDEQLKKWREEMAKMSQPQNTASWLPLLPGMKAVANTQFRIDPVSAELLMSRYFGIEEICRFMGVPPPLIGHTDKASSWASSLDGLNQFLVTYTLLPQAIRLENQIRAKLLGRNHGLQLKPTFNMDSLNRGDIAKRFDSYEIGIQNGIFSPNEVRARENLPNRPGGDIYINPTKNLPVNNTPNKG